MFCAERLTLTYTAAATAVEDFSVSLAKGERLAVLGASGAGKTSLLKCIAGLYPATAGRIFVNGRDITDLKLKARGVQMLFEDLGLAPYSSLRSNLLRLFRFQKISRAEAKSSLYSLTTEFGLTRVLTYRAKTLSDDDAVRAAFLRTRIRNADLVLIDNPFKKCYRRREMFLEMLPHLNAIKSTAIFATDEADEAFTFGDRIALLHFGVTEQIGTREELINFPASLIVDKTVNPHKSVLKTTLSVTQTGAVVTVLGKPYPVVTTLEEGAHTVIVTCPLAESTEGASVEAQGNLSIKGTLYAVNKKEDDFILIKRTAHTGGNTVAAVADGPVTVYEFATEKNVGKG